MNQALWDALLEQFPASAASGTLDLTQIPSSTASSTLFGDYGIATSLSLSGGAWSQDDDGNFSLSTAITSSFLGLTTPVTATIAFLGSGTDADPNPLVVTVTLPSGWTMGATFPALANTLVDSLSASSGTLTLASSATATAVQGMAASFSATSTAPTVALLFDLLDSGEATIAVAGPISLLQSGTLTSGVAFDLAAAGATTSLALSDTTSLQLTFGFSGGLDATGSYVSGLQCTATVPYTDQGGTVSEVGLSGVLQGRVASVIEISLAGGPINFPSAATIADLFGSADFTSAIPTDASQSSLQLQSLSLGVTLSPPGISYGSLAIGTQSGYTFPLFGDLSVTGIVLVGTITGPLSTPSWSLRLSGTVGIGSLKIAAFGALPAEMFGGQLAEQTDDDIPTILTSLGLETIPPQLDGLTIDELSFSANVSESVYALDISVSDSWQFTVGTDNTIEITELGLKFESDNGATSLTITGALDFNTAHFAVELDTGTSATLLKGWWSDPTAPISYIDLTIALGLYGLPSLPADIDIALTAASFEIDLSTLTFTFTLTTAAGSSALLVVGEVAGGWGYLYGAVLGETLSVNLTNIDLLSELVPAGGDVLSISAMRMEGGSTTLPTYDPAVVTPVLGSQINSGLALSADFAIGSDTVTLLAQFGGYNNQSDADVPPATSDDDTGSDGDTASAPATPQAAPSPGPGLTTSQASSGGTTAPAAPSITWENVQRKFGPLQIDRIGYSLSGGASATVLIDGGIALGGFTLALSGLSATIPLQSPYVPSFSLQGLSVSYSAPPLLVSGSLQVIDDDTFAGTLAVSTENFGLSVLCSYTTGAAPSLFAYATLDAPLGGPPCFFVQGLAAGFGYNEALPTITIDQVATSPFVEAALGKPVTVSQVRSIVDPQPNQNWATAGVLFSSFEIVQTFALLTVSFGTEFEVGLLGLSTLSMPPAVDGQPPVTPVAQVQMAIDVSVQPALGQVAVSATLTPASYILSQSAQLTGGFAFYLWFGRSAYAGQFVVTLGGYSSYFTPPSYYPTVAPLGLNWAVSPGMQVKGGIYFALTPAVAMAGGALQATWQSSSVTACFDARVDFLLRFQPFHYELDVSVSISLTLQLDLLVTTKTIHVQLGVDLSLWGPEFGGTAEINLSVATFSVSFGSSGSSGATADLSWSAFRSALLPPEPPAVKGPAAPTALLAAADAPAGTPTAVLITCNAVSGLVSTAGGTATVLPTAVFLVALQVPSKTLTVDGDAADVSAFNTAFGIGPMGVSSDQLGVDLVVSTTADVMPTWTVQPGAANLAAGVWLNTTAAVNAQAMVENVLTQVTLTPTAAAPTNTPIQVSAAQLQASGDYPVVTVPWSGVVPPATDTFDPSDALGQLETTIVATDVAATRSAILASLQAQGLTTVTALDLAAFAADAAGELQAAPMLRLLGETR